MPDQDLSWKDAIKMVLIDAVDPMHYTDIADQIIERGLRTEVGATPAATVSSTITVSINSEQERSPFIRISRGYYALRDTDGSTPIEQVGAEEADFIQQEETGFINAFGMYWARDKVLWASATPKLLGRQNPKSTVVDFANQKGVRIYSVNKPDTEEGGCIYFDLGNK
ncbi:MAG TPA: winged helix-turn-helix domain-containing protein [Candidatus Fermentibacter daniensis]|nr:winged helix-turn-helix domain-containing protein [Candidatus Fermentibacter daniensis]